MSLTAREEILQWHLRQLVMYHKIGVLMSGWAALGSFFIGWQLSIDTVRWILGGVLFSFAAAVCAARLIRLLNRLQTLEQFEQLNS